MISDIGAVPEELEVDGGACANNFLMQFQSDITGLTVARPKVLETTAMGAAMLAGLYIGFFSDAGSLLETRETERVFTPQMDRAEVNALLEGWSRAVFRSLDWERANK